MRRVVLGFLLGAGVAGLLPLADAGNFPGEQPTYGRDQGRTSLFFYVASGNGANKVQYICTADPGTGAGAAGWQITRFTYDSSDRVTNIEWAGGTDAFTSICNNRTTLTYS